MWISNVENADWMVAVTRTIPAGEASPQHAGFTLFLVDVKKALAAGTLSYNLIIIEDLCRVGASVVSAGPTGLQIRRGAAFAARTDRELADLAGDRLVARRISSRCRLGIASMIVASSS